MKHSKGILLAIWLLLYSQERKWFLNCKQKNNWSCYLVKSCCFTSEQFCCFFFFSKPKGWECPPVVNCSFGGANWFILWNYFQCVNWFFFCLLTLNRDQLIDLPYRSDPTKCRGGTDVPIIGIQCGAEEAEVVFLPLLLLCGTDTKSVFLLKLFLSRFCLRGKL